MRALDRFKLFCLIQDKFKILSKHLKFRQYTVGNSKLVFALNQSLDPILNVELFLKKQFEKVSIKQKGIWKVELIVSSEKTYNLTDLLIIHQYPILMIILDCNNIKMINEGISSYHDLPLLEDTNDPMLEGRNFVLYDELVIDITNFDHPGSKNLLINLHQSNIQKSFQANKHSENAELMLINLTIGKLRNSKGSGRQLWSKASQRQLVQIHETAISKLNFKEGLLDQLRKLSPEELEAFVTIPKYFNKNQSIKFHDNQWQQAWYLDHFWLSTFVFTVILISVAYYLLNNGGLFGSIFKIILFFVGIMKWTAIQYYFHRFMLHQDLSKNQKLLNGHYLHHAFPNHKNKIALSISRNLTYQILMVTFYTQALNITMQDTLHLMLGLHFFMIFYDCLHYYFHFGKELNIPILKELKRNHLSHHYKNKNARFGVTNTFWDYVFGTLE